MSKLIILRGIAGSGKTRLALALASSWSGAARVVSADSYPGLYYTDAGGVVRIDMARLDPAHGACFDQAMLGLQRRELVIVDNTNLTAIEAAPYVLLAQARRVPCDVVRVSCDPAVAFERQSHGVPLVNHQAMQALFTADERAPHWQFLSWLTFREVRS